jgi:Tn3 transposase DDE domain
LRAPQFNDFAQWLMFGGEGVIAETSGTSSARSSSTNHLVANMVILYNMQWMSLKLKELQGKASDRCRCAHGAIAIQAGAH